jgi:hypothetical protein
MNKPVFEETTYWNEKVYMVSRKKDTYTVRRLEPKSFDALEETLSDFSEPNEFGIKLTKNQFENEVFDRINAVNTYLAECKWYKIGESTSPTVFNMIKRDFASLRHSLDWYLGESRVVDFKYDVDWRFDDLDAPATAQIMLLGEDGFPTGEWLTVDIKTVLTKAKHNSSTPIFSHSQRDIYWHNDNEIGNNAYITVAPRDNNVVSCIQWNCALTEVNEYLSVLESFTLYLRKFTQYVKTHGEVKWRKQ